MTTIVRDAAAVVGEREACAALDRENEAETETGDSLLETAPN